MVTGSSKLDLYRRRGWGDCAFALLSSSLCRSTQLGAMAEPPAPLQFCAAPLPVLSAQAVVRAAPLMTQDAWAVVIHYLDDLHESCTLGMTCAIMAFKGV